ncbi:MAG: NAD(P)/FAD-dependent oxidoreductase [Bacteroidales bacterium]|jgi:protoporphyrinogen oxidase|nr:NAD(P)/FAD-dependent oxidoreductase [Bacteroidales bacterium]
MNNKKQVIIIGAGPAGITAGYELAKEQDYEVKVFEQDSQIGGISKTINYKGNLIDTGIHRFFSKDDTIMDWWANILPVQTKPALDDILLERKLNLKTNDKISDPQTMDRVMLIRNRVSRIFYLKKFFDYPISLSFQTFANMGLWRTVKAGFGYFASIIHKRKETSLENFYINRFGKPLYRMFFENYTEKVWGVHPSKLGADWGSQRVKGVSVTKIIVDVITKPFKSKSSKNIETSLIESFVYPKLGAGQIWEEAAKEIVANGSTVELNNRIKQINVKNNKVISVITEDNGEDKTVECDLLLSSMPIKDLILAMNGIEIPNDVREAALNLPYREFMSVGLFVKKLLLENKTDIKTINNIVPDSWIYIQESNVKLGRLQVFNNWSPYAMKHFQDEVLIGCEYFCDEGDELWNMTDEDFIQLAIDELVKIKIINREDVTDAVRIKIKKAYPAYHGSYYDLPKVIDFLNSVENLYCIGRNGQHRYNNMDHSMLTGIEAVNHILGKTADKQSVWNVNTEKEYHETKK